MQFDVTSLTHRRADNPWDRLAIGDISKRMTWSFPQQEALISWEGARAYEENARLTYKELDDKANQFANALLEKGLQRADKIFMFALNSAEYFISQIGAAKAGIVMVPVNVMIAQDVIQYIIEQTEPKFTLIDAQFYSKLKYFFEHNLLAPGVTIPLGGEIMPGGISFSKFISGKSKKEPEVNIHADDIVEILYTAGTTAMPKGVMLSHLYLYMTSLSHALTHSRGAGVLTEWDYRHGIYYPIFHIAAQGMLLSTLVTGGTSVMTRMPVAKHMVETMSEERLTAVFGGPVDYARIARLYEDNPQKYATDYLRIGSCGWGPMDPEVDKKLRSLFGKDLILLSYDGQTECVYDTRGWHHKFYEKYEENAPAANYLGVSHPFYATRIVDSDMNTAPRGQTGEKVMQSPCMMAGYYKDKQGTREAFRGGWFHGGDACRYDEDGDLIMTDRIKDIIKSRGENISTIRVESVIKTHPQVEMAAVFGVPDKKQGEAVVAAVVSHSGEGLTEAEVLKFCRKKLANYETPRKVLFVEELPISVGSKVQKFKLREWYKDLFQE
ncbi:MAG: class I adenylate-forming enzyme family protein [Desulfonatronovibrionaceae bacterium]